VAVYPNPVKDDFVTIALDDLKGSHVQFYNTLGQLVKYTNLENGSPTNIPTGDLAKGIYELVITTDKGTANKRLVIE